MAKRLMAACVLVAAVNGVSFGQGAYKHVQHSETLFAHQLLQLEQADLIKAQEAAAKGTGSENLWKAQSIAGNWAEIAKSPADSAKATTEYLAAMKAFLSMSPPPQEIDGIWALDHAKFIFGQLSQRVMVRMENYGNSVKDRAGLSPMADLADQLLTIAQQNLDAQTRWFESQKNFDQWESSYNRSAGGLAEVEYYAVWGKYFKAMAMEPGTKARKDLLLSAASALERWADEPSDNGVNKQALLLRGKLRSEAGDLVNAVSDLKKAGSDGPGEVKSPEWVKYQSSYQIIVTRIRAKDFATAYEEYKAFKKSLPADNKIAQMSAEMLKYRITWAEAETLKDKAQKDKQLEALAILGEIIKTEPGFRTLIFDQLGAQISEGAKLEEMLPMQQLAIAYSRSTGQQGDTPASKDALKEAVKACAAVIANASSTKADKLEALYLAAICSDVLHENIEAVKYSLEYCKQAPKDEASKKVLDRALALIHELRTTPEGQKPEVKELTDEALALSTGSYKDPKLMYAYMMTLMRDNKLDEATKVGTKIEVKDPNYVNARYAMVNISLMKFESLMAKKAPETELHKASTDLFNACATFVSMLDNPPASVDKKAIEDAKKFRTDILMIEVATALNPVIKRQDIVKDRLAKLDAVRKDLPANKQGEILKYRIQYLQMSGGAAEEIMKVVDEYAKASGKDPVEIIKGLAFSTLDEIARIERTNPEKAKNDAVFVVKLFDPIISRYTSEGKKKEAFELRELKADLMVRAGDYKGAKELSLKLQAEEPARLSSFMSEARASFFLAQDSKKQEDWQYARDYFEKILPRMNPSNDSYWEAWLRVIECTEALRGSGASDEIKKKLSDLKGSTSNFGGEAYKEDFDALARKYGVK